MKTIVHTLTALTLSLALGGCDSRQENQREQALENRADTLENRADATRDSAETQADALEDRDADHAADAVRDNAEHRADQLEDQADQVRENKD